MLVVFYTLHEDIQFSKIISSINGQKRSGWARVLYSLYWYTDSHPTKHHWPV